jgi:periplasmic protein TonB
MSAVHSSQKFYAFSVLGHLLVLIFGASYFQEEIISRQIGETNEEVVQSYVMSEPAKPVENIVAARGDKVVTAQNKKVVAVHQQTVTASKSRGETVDALLTLLHTAIQSRQHYPASAMEMEREGRVRVAFTLQPSGEIQQLQLLKSSGTASLDTAGLQAVRDAAPFKGVKTFLSAAREFQIDVVFTLS